MLASITIGFHTSSAQSIVGKWKGVSVKNYYSAEGAKVTGKTVEEKNSKEAGDSAIEYKPDHTFIMNFSALNSSDVMTMKGIWSLTKNQLKLTFEPQYNPKKSTTTATISINGNTLITTAVLAPPSRVLKTVSISRRI